jgi:hypothetical protein
VEALVAVPDPGRDHSVTVGGIIQEYWAASSRFTWAASSESSGFDRRKGQNVANRPSPQPQKRLIP